MRGGLFLGGWGESLGRRSILQGLKCHPATQQELMSGLAAGAARTLPGSSDTSAEVIWGGVGLSRVPLGVVEREKVAAKEHPAPLAPRETEAGACVQQEAEGGWVWGDTL